MSLVILVPMLGRPHTVAPLLESIEATTEDWRVLFLLTPGDDEVLEAVKTETDEDLLFVDWQDRGDYARKINAGIRATTGDHVFTGACDLRFHPGWYEAAAAQLTPGIGVVGTNDLSPRGAATHFLATREYAQLGTIDGQPGLYFEGYRHEFVDDELIGTAQRRSAYAYAPDAHVEHLHPDWGKAEWDDTYRAMPQRMREDRPLFRRRRLLWM